MKLPGLVPPPEVPLARAPVPGLAVPAAFTILGVVLSLVDYGLTGWFGVGIVLSVAAAWLPQFLLGWVLILFLAAGRLAHHAALNWQFLVLLLGLHLLHVLALLALEMPWRSWAQPRVFVAPLRRFLVIQIPTQVFAALALLVLAPSSSGHRPLTVAGFAVVGALALAALALLLTGPHLDDPRLDDPRPPSGR
jgi:hypothetical protein